MARRRRQALPAEAPLERAIRTLQRLSEAFMERREQLARQAGLTVGQWRVLEQIETDEFMPSLFAKERARSAGAVSKVLKSLGEQGFVRVAVGKGDARKRDYALTPRGRQAVLRLARSRERAIEDVWSELSPRDLVRFAEFGEELADRLERYASGKT